MKFLTEMVQDMTRLTCVASGNEETVGNSSAALQNVNLLQSFHLHGLGRRFLVFSHGLRRVDIRPGANRNPLRDFKILTSSPKHGLGAQPMTDSSAATIQPFPLQAMDLTFQPERSVTGLGYMLASLEVLY
jgi:hypothetical protein